MTPDGTPRLGRTILLTAGVGGGHLRAAQAVEQAIRLGASEGRWQVESLELVDVLDHACSPFRAAYRDGYLGLIRHAPTLLGWLYERSDVPWRGRRLRSVVNRACLGRLRAHLRRQPPAHVISTHFLASEFVADLRTRGELSCALSTVVTDMDVHGLWFTAPCERYFVATEEACEILAAGGVQRDRVQVTGIPIDPRFERLPARREARDALGLPQDRPVVVFASGGAGTGRLEAIFEALLRVECAAHVVAICGRNEQATRALEACLTQARPRCGFTAQVMGFTDRMHEWMAAADLLVGKPGGLTSSEARAAGLPILIVDPVPGQEEHNAAHLLEWGVAARASSLATLSWRVSRMLADTTALSDMRQRALRLARPSSAREVAASVAAMAVGATAGPEERAAAAASLRLCASV